MGRKGVIFDIKEFAVFDGPGIRTTVFFKGCPLRCQWCHNPEGLCFERELMVSPNGCTRCGRCLQVCPDREHFFGGPAGVAEEGKAGGFKRGDSKGKGSCALCGRCVDACRLHLRKLCGTEYGAEQLCGNLDKDREFLKRNGGGVTFSGGEALAQPLFLKEVLKGLPQLHKAVETSGFCEGETFQEIVGLLDLVIMDIKLVDEGLHKRYTGVSNRPILENLSFLKRGGKPYIIRVPLIPGVSDTKDNLERTAALLEDARDLEGVELLPYHVTAGAKYAMTGREYCPGFEIQRRVNADTGPFTARGISCRVL